MTPAVVRVELGLRSYEVAISRGFPPARLAERLGGRRAFVVSDSVVHPLYGQALRVALPHLIGEAVIPAGESSKSMACAEQVIGELLRAGADRHTVVLALGGGVVGDLAGFVAGTFMRGVPFIQLPTTLLAMIDSSVGGKVAVNHPQGKNLIGVFHQPEAVFAAVDTLSTLARREVNSGLGEMIKHGVILDRTYFEWVEERAERLAAADPEILVEAVRRSVEIKARVVEQDEREEKGLRALLNLGHTFGHAEETLRGYGTVLHGEAVAAGMVAACHLSAEEGRMPAGDALRVERLLRGLNLPVRLLAVADRAAFWRAMEGDKKSAARAVRFIVPSALGACEPPRVVPREIVDRVLDRLAATA